MSEIVIRPAKAEDFPAVLALLRQLWPDKELDCPALEELFRTALGSERDALFCATCDAAVAGFCAVSYYRCFWYAGEAAYLSTLVVDEARRGGGIGAKLLHAAKETARSRGCRGIDLDSLMHREDAHRFYERHGFAKLAYHFLETF